MRWIPLSKAVSLSSKSERTLRNYATQGKIRVKKNGKSWICDLNSLIEIGLYLEEKPSSPIQNVPEKSSEVSGPPESSKMFKPPNEERKKERSIKNLGVYSEIINLYKDINEKIKKPSNKEIDKEIEYKEFFNEKTLSHIKMSILSIAIGYYENKVHNKIDSYSKAKSYLVNFLILIQFEILIQTPENLSEIYLNSVFDKIEKSIIPGLNGLIRKMENINYGSFKKNDRPSHYSKS